MRITSCRSVNGVKTQRILILETALKFMQTETKSKPVSNLRNSLQYTLPGDQNEYVEKLPVFTFGGAFRKKGNKQELIEYNGLVTLEINKLSGIKEAIKLRDLASTFPQTLVSFIGSSGKSVKIIIPFTLPDGTLPQTPELVKTFHTQAYRDAVKWYQPQLKREIDLKKPVVERGCRMSYDPKLYYNPAAVAIRLEQPLRMPDEPTFTEVQHAASDPLERLLPGYERNRIISILFDTCLLEAINQIDGIDWETDELKPFLTKLAQNCYHSGIPEEEGVKWTLLYRDLKQYEIPMTKNRRPR